VRGAVTNVQHNLIQYGCVRKPLQNKLGRHNRIAGEDAQALFDELLIHGWMYQAEMVRWLDVERGVYVNQSTVSRFLKKQGWTRRTLRPCSIDRNEELRESYRNCMRRYAADDVVFLDESIFNEKSGWRHHAYAPVGHPARYTQDIRRGKTWAILPAYTIDGYLPCTAVKEGYFNREDFLEWIVRKLLPTLRTTYGDKPMVIVLDNVSIHTNDVITKVLRGASHVVRYLPPYSPDYNPIELTFAVLKAWIRRNYCYMRSRFPGEGGFGRFLKAAITESRCDRFAQKHFKYAAGGLYIERTELERAREQLRHEIAFNWE
jgi:transposase